MRRLVLAFLVAALTILPFGGTALAKCPTCLDGVSVQTSDGQPWSSGKPVTVVVSARRGAPGAEFPANGLAVVMRTDGDRTKCLDVPLRLVKSSGDSALYAGIFYPFRAAAYDGKLSLGDQTFDIRFDVNTLLAPKAETPIVTAHELPIGSTEEAYGPSLSDLAGIAPLGALLAMFAIGAAWCVRRGAPRVRFAL